MTEQLDTEKSIDAIIKGAPEQTEQVGHEDATKEPEVQEAKVEKTATTAEDKESWTKTAVLDERRKRQELEARLAEYESKKSEAEAVKRPDILEDQEGAFRHTESQFAYKILQERINLSRELMIDKHDDYEAMENVFVEIAKQNPLLVQEMNNSPNPAKFAYMKAKEHSDYVEYTKNSSEFKAYLEAKKSGALDAKVEDSPEKKRAKSAVNVPDLINATSVKSGHVEGEKSLKQILSGR